MLYEKTLAIPLRHKPFKENHKLVTLFTEKHGLVHAVGYGMGHFGSKRAGNLDIMNLCEIEFVRRKQVWSIHTGKSIKAHSSCKRNLEKSETALKNAVFLLSNIALESPNKNLFDLFIEFLNTLETLNTNYNFEFLSNIFQAKALYLLGHFPTIRNSRCKCENSSAYTILLDPFSIKCDICLKRSLLPVEIEILNELIEIEEKPFPEIVNVNYSEKTERILKALIGRFGAETSFA